MTLEQKASEMRNALDAIELALMGVEDLPNLPALFETTDENVTINLRMTVGMMRQICTALDECTHIVNSPDFTPAALSGAALESKRCEMNIRERLLALSHPAAEAIGDQERLTAFVNVGFEAAAEIERLRATNAELLTALEHIRRFIQSHQGDDETAGFALGIADAAIAKARGKD